MRYVAKTAGVSVATVSRVINEAPTVNPAIAERVKAVMEELQYVPNDSARTFRRQRSRTWCIVVPDIRDSYYMSLVAGIENHALEAGYRVMLCNSDDDVKREKAYLETAVSKRVDGLIAVPVSPLESDFQIVKMAGIPMLIVDRLLPGYKGISVVSDNYAIGAMAAQHLYDSGAVNPAFLIGPAGVSSTESRQDGYTQRYKSLTGIVPSIIRVGKRGAELARIVRGKLLAEYSGDTRSPIDGFFVANGRLTVELYSVLLENGVKIPQQMKLIGVDDDRWAKLATPSVTMIDQDVESMAEVASRELLYIIDSASNIAEDIGSGYPAAGAEKTKVFSLQAKLIVRQSTCT